jgi:hypothetical protein
MLQLKDLWGRSGGDEVKTWDGSVDSRCSRGTDIFNVCAARVRIEAAGIQLIQKCSTASANCQYIL